MIDIVKRLLNLEPSGGQAGSDSHFQKDSDPFLAQISAKLDGLNPPEAERIISLAFLLCRVALADHHMTDEEEKQIAETLRSKFSLSDEHLSLLLELLHDEQKVFGSTKNYSLTKGMAESFSEAEKVKIMECLFRVAAADQRLTPEEESELRNITSQLGLDDGVFIDLRIQYRELRSD